MTVIRFVRRASYVVVWDGTPATSRYLSITEERRREPADERRAYAEEVLEHSTSADRRARAAIQIRTAATRRPPVGPPPRPGGAWGKG